MWSEIKRYSDMCKEVQCKKARRRNEGKRKREEVVSLLIIVSRWG